VLGCRNKRNPASLATLAMRLYRDFHILVECSQHTDELFHRNQLKLATKQL
jgi:hypothetical protein